MKSDDNELPHPPKCFSLKFYCCLYLLLKSDDNEHPHPLKCFSLNFYCCLLKSIYWVGSKSDPSLSISWGLTNFNPLVDVDRSWCFFFLLQPGTRVLFHVIYILQRKNFVMTLQCQSMLGDDKHQASNSLERKK